MEKKEVSKPRGKWEPDRMQDILAAKDRKAAGPTAPACGLTLVKYEFSGLTDTF